MTYFATLLPKSFKICEFYEIEYLSTKLIKLLKSRNKLSTIGSKSDDLEQTIVNFEKFAAEVSRLLHPFFHPRFAKENTSLKKDCENLMTF